MKPFPIPCQTIKPTIVSSKVCRHLQQCQPILVTKDLVLRLKAHDECERSPLALDAIQRL